MSQDAFTKYAEQAGREDDRPFDELMDELEQANKNPDFDGALAALRLLYSKAAPRWQNEATRLLKEGA